MFEIPLYASNVSLFFGYLQYEFFFQCVNEMKLFFFYKRRYLNIYGKYL